MDTTPAFHPLDYLSVVRRRMWWLIVPVVVAAVAGTALVIGLPRSYQAAATLGVAIPAVSQELVANAQHNSPEERLRNIRQILLSQPVLERVVKEEGLDKEQPVVEAVNDVRERLELDLPKADPSLPEGAAEQFSVRYTDSTPQRTQRVVNKVAEVFVQENSRRKEVRAEETSAFIGMQVQGSQMRLNEIEERLRQAQEAYMGALPEQTNANVAMMTGVQQQLETTSNAIRAEQDRLGIIERQVEGMKAGASTTDPSVPGLPSTTPASMIQVIKLQRDLDAALTAYTAKHPEVIRLKEELAGAKAAAAADANRPEEERTASLGLDPGYRSLLGDREQSRLRIRDLQRQEQQIRGQIGVYRMRVESAPRVEQQVATLKREYELEKNQYGELTSRLRSAEMSENLVRNRGGEEFTILARAALPSAPVSPNAQRILMVAMLVGMCLGGGLALGREYLDRAIHDARSLNDLDLPVLGEIPRIGSVA